MKKSIRCRVSLIFQNKQKRKQEEGKDKGGPEKAKAMRYAKYVCGVMWWGNGLGPVCVAMAPHASPRQVALCWV